MSRDFHCYISDFTTLTKVKRILKYFASELPLIIHDDHTLIDKGIGDSVFIVDAHSEYFIDHFTSIKKKNILIVINDVIEDDHDFPVEAYITKNTFSCIPKCSVI